MGRRRGGLPASTRAVSAAAGWDARLRLRLAVLGLVLFVYLTVEMFPVGALPELSTGLGVEESRAGLLLSGYAVAAGVTTVPVVVLLSSLDRRTVLSAAMLVLAGSQVGLAVAPTFEVAMAARAITAVAHGYVWAMVPVVATSLAPEGSRGRATATVFVGSTAGLVVGSPLSAAMSQTVGWRVAAVTMGAVAAVAAVMVLLTLPALPGRPHGRASGRVVGGREWARPVAVVCVVTMALAAAHYVSYTFLAVLVGSVGIDGTPYALLLAAYGVAGLVGVHLVGRHVDATPRATAIVLVGVLVASLAALGPAIHGGWRLVVVTLVLL